MEKPQVDGEVAAGDEADSYRITNGTDALLWLELAEGATRNALLERLAQAHLIDPKRAAAESFFTGLRERGSEEL